MANHTHHTHHTHQSQLALTVGSRIRWTGSSGCSYTGNVIALDTPDLVTRMELAAGNPKPTPSYTGPEVMLDAGHIMVISNRFAVEVIG